MLPPVELSVFARQVASGDRFAKIIHIMNYIIHIMNYINYVKAEESKCCRFSVPMQLNIIVVTPT